MHIQAFFDDSTFTLTYLAYDRASRDAVIIDPVLDLDPHAWRTSTHSIDRVLQVVDDQGLHVRYILDTHAHADHLSGMQVLKERLKASTAIGEKITQVQKFFARAYNLKDFAADGRQWDQLLHHGQRLAAGTFEIKTIHTPGHTPACLSYQIGDAVFTGDALFMPDYGTGRCDFPGGSAEDLYESVHEKLYRLADDTRVFVGHDYQPGGRPLRFETTIGDSKEKNIHLRAATTSREFIEKRKARDAELSAPRLILPALQVNIEAGRLPEPEDNGRRYLRMPLNLLER